MVPTRELAVQVREEAVKLSHGRKVHIVALYGGKPIRGQIEKLQRGAELVIGTPGRVLDHMGRGTLPLGDLKFVVLDEADRMLDIGFRPDIERILAQLPRIAANAAAQRHGAAAGRTALEAIHARSGNAQFFVAR